MLRLTLKPSRFLAVVIIVAHTAAAGTLLPLDLPAWATVILALAILASLAHALLRHALLRSPGCLKAIELRDNDSAAAQTRDGTWHEGRVLGTSYVSPLVTVINLRLEAWVFARHVLIVPDNADAECFRLLRVWLRWGYRNAPGGVGGDRRTPMDVH